MKNLTKVTRESVGEWIFKLLSKPEWVESKFRYWAFYMMIAGFVLLLVHRHIQKIQGPLSLRHARHRNRGGFIVGSTREAKPPLHLLSESVH
jgi:hypothetical protein